jgi:hypothetical protein
MEETSTRGGREPFFVVPFEGREANAMASDVSSAEGTIEVGVLDGVVIRVAWGSRGRGLTETLRSVLAAVRA